jgi:predicted phage tail protein
MPEGGGGPIAPISMHSDPSDGGIVDPATGVKMATLTDGGLVDAVTGVKVVSSASDSTTVSDLAPAAAAVGGAIALVILGASFGLGGGDRRRPALT